MKAIVLAAGMGTRVSRFIEERPKCMVDIGGQTLIEYTVDLLRRNGIEEVIVAVGYKAEVIMEKLRQKNVKFAYNPFYDVTNGIASMWFAKDYLDETEETIIMSGDVYMEEDILKELLCVEKDPVLLADSSRIIEADYRYYYENDILLKFGKDLSVAETTGECVGVAKLKPEFVGRYKAHMLEMINKQIHSVWWESVLYDMAADENIYVHDIAGSFWAEVDFIEDYNRILSHRRAKNQI